MLPDLVWDDALEPLRVETEQLVRRTLAEASEFAETGWSPDVELADDPMARCWQLAGIAPVGDLDRLTLLRATSTEELLTRSRAELTRGSAGVQFRRRGRRTSPSEPEGWSPDGSAAPAGAAAADGPGSPTTSSTGISTWRGASSGSSSIRPISRPRSVIGCRTVVSPRGAAAGMSSKPQTDTVAGTSTPARRAALEDAEGEHVAEPDDRRGQRVAAEQPLATRWPEAKSFCPAVTIVSWPPRRVGQPGQPRARSPRSRCRGGSTTCTVRAGRRVVGGRDDERRRGGRARRGARRRGRRSAGRRSRPSSRRGRRAGRWSRALMPRARARSATGWVGRQREQRERVDVGLPDDGQVGLAVSS